MTFVMPFLLSFLDGDRADGTAVPGLLGAGEDLLRDGAAVGEAVITHGEDFGAGACAQAAADAVLVDHCFHIIHLSLGRH